MLPIARPPNPNASVRQVSPAKTTKPDANAGSAHPVPLEPARRRLNGTKVKKSQCRWHVTGYAAGGQTKKMAFFRQTLISLLASSASDRSLSPDCRPLNHPTPWDQWVEA